MLCAAERVNHPTRERSVLAQWCRTSPSSPHSLRCCRKAASDSRINVNWATSHKLLSFAPRSLFFQVHTKQCLSPTVRLWCQQIDLAATRVGPRQFAERASRVAAKAIPDYRSRRADRHQDRTCNPCHLFWDCSACSLLSLHLRSNKTH